MIHRHALKGALLGVIATGSLSSCDRQATKVQYMPDMADSPTVKAQENYLMPPDASVAMNAVIYPDSPEEAERLLTNTLPINPKTLARGKEMFETYCSVCHGADGRRRSEPLSATAPVPPDLTADIYKNKGDGHFFYVISKGIRAMPSYGQETDTVDRWAIIHYLRTLQEGA